MRLTDPAIESFRDLVHWPREVRAQAPLARALYDHHRTGRSRSVRVERGEGFDYRLDTGDFFTLEGPMAAIDRLAVESSRGRVLDAGAGAGRHALALQARGLEVVAADVEPLCVRLMRERGVTEAVVGDVFAGAAVSRLAGEGFDTVLFGMQTIGAVGSRAALVVALRRMCDWLRPGGQVLLDSSAPATPEADGLLSPSDDPREVCVAFSYRNWRGAPFDWLYLDETTLAEVAAECSMRCKILERTSPEGEYLARLMPERAPSPAPHPA